jgi:hypothetical protein
VLIADKSFGQNIRGLLVGRGVLKTNLLALDFVPQKVVSHFNVLGAVMELGVVCDCDCDCGLVVDMEYSW